MARSVPDPNHSDIRVPGPRPIRPRRVPNRPNVIGCYCLVTHLHASYDLLLSAMLLSLTSCLVMSSYLQ